jgi:hypothetical protein
MLVNLTSRPLTENLASTAAVVAAGIGALRLISLKSMSSALAAHLN